MPALHKFGFKKFNNAGKCLLAYIRRLENIFKGEYIFNKIDSSLFLPSLEGYDENKFI